MRSKSDAAMGIPCKIKYFEKWIGRTVFKIHVGEGTKLYKAPIYLENENLKIGITTLHTPESNELAKRIFQTILAFGKTWIAKADLPLKYWAYAIRKWSEVLLWSPIW